MPHVKPKVSVILPARNEEDFIEKCLASLLDQDYEDYEIIAIDDRSEDKTREIIKKWQKKILRLFTYGRSKTRKMDGKKLGHVFEGFKKSTGELLLLQMQTPNIQKKHDFIISCTSSKRES